MISSASGVSVNGLLLSNCQRKRPSKFIQVSLYIRCLKVPRFFFKKWLELEKKLGDDAGLDFVKQKAIEWTQNAQNANNGTVTSA